MTMASAPSAVTVHPVSMSDSPFSMLEEVAVMSVVVAPESFGGELERRPGAGGGLVEKQHDALAAQELRRTLGIHAARELQDGINFGDGELVGAQQTTHVRLHCPSATRSTISTFSAPSVSWSLTSMISWSVVCTLRPTNPASMGSSRWPRSMSTSS